MHLILKKSGRIALRSILFVFSSFLLVGLTLLISHAVSVRDGPDLEWWHTQEISAEFVEDDQSDITTLAQYLANEEKVFQQLDKLEQKHLGDSAEQYLNRFTPGNAAYPVKQGRNFNRTYEIRPDHIKGGVLLLHGLTDSPYSLRHLGDMFAAQGFYVLALRVPGHGTIPAELDRLVWEDWHAAAQLGARHVAGELGSNQPFFIAGYSNGAALALKYTLDAVADKAQRIAGKKRPRKGIAADRIPDQVVVFSPMIAVDTLAKYSPVFLWLGDLNFFKKSRWMDLQPEYDPHKYNSFPVNAGLQSYRVSTTVSKQISKMHDQGQLQYMPPILAFQSLVDKTIIASAVFDNLFQKLPDNGSELVMFDLNRFGQLEKFIQPRHEALLDRIMQQDDGDFTLSVISNKRTDSRAVLELRKPHGQTEFASRNLPYQWPGDVYSLTHVAIPFPLNDEVYGLEPEDTGSGFPHLGDIQLLGESGTLVLPTALLQRLRSNPFYDYVQGRVEETIKAAEVLER